MSKQVDLTHWLQNPNKNYLGHWDLPNGKDVILTIQSAEWEEVKDPITKASESKRVIRFIEKFEWLKPFICNQINAQSILKSTGEKFMEKSVGKKIKLSVGQTKVKGEEVDCLRVRVVSQALLSSDKITKEEASELETLIEKARLDKIEWCKSVKITAISELQKAKFPAFVKRLKELANGNN